MLKKLLTIVFVIISLFMLGECMGGDRSSRDQIIQFFLDNEEFLNKAVAEIENLDEYVSYIANTRFRPRDGLGFEGLYKSGIVDAINVTTPLDNPILYELLKDGIIRSISIRRADPIRGTTYQIQFAFRTRGFWDRYEGVYFSKNDEPTTFNGREWINPEPKGEGWVSYGRHFYYTERIVAHWFYYEMLFSSNRTP